MKTLFLFICALSLACAAPKASAVACKTPPTTSQGNTWLPNSVVHIASSSGTLTAPLASSIKGWNSTLSTYIVCSGLSFSATAGTLVLSMGYAAIAQQNGHTVRGTTTVTSSNNTDHRITGATSTIYNKVTNATTIASIISHEIGHTMGLYDCNKCGLNTTVMEAGDTIANINVQINPVTPTSCDGVASAKFYTCPKCSLRPPDSLQDLMQRLHTSPVMPASTPSCIQQSSVLVGRASPDKEPFNVTF